MSLSPRSYGSAADVADLTGKFTKSGVFDTTTHPTLATVEKWIDKVSATLNVLLAEQGFAVPAKQADVVQTLALFVVTQVADLVNYANSAGRFFQDKNLKTGPWQAIQKEAAEFIAEHAEGLQKLGASRTTGGLDGLDFRESDDSGDPIEPMFNRKQFGTRNVDYDT